MAEREERRDVIRYDGDGFMPAAVPVVREAPFTLYLNGREFITLLCHPEHLDELALGFLASEGLVSSRSDVRRISIGNDGTTAEVDADVRQIDERLHEKRMVTTGCGKGSVFYFAIDALKCEPRPVAAVRTARQLIDGMALVTEPRRKDGVGGLHVCALETGDTRVVRSDVGRHNALDKLAGYCLMNGIPTGDATIYTTGRISSEMLLKSAKIGASTVVSRSTPTSLALDIAVKLGITVVGYLRGGTFTVYCGAERLETEGKGR